jgi:3-oxoadipate enol-lactonase
MHIDDLGAPFQGAPVVAFLHPFPFDGRFFGAVAPPISRHARCLVADFRGYGRSREEAWTTLDGHADDLAEALDRLGIDRAVLVGLSFGGYVALVFARRFPSRVAGLVLASTRATADTAKLLGQRAQAAQLVRTKGVHALVAHQAPTWFGRATPAPDAAEARARDFATRLALGQRPHAVQNGIAALRDRTDELAGLDALRVPTVVLSGEVDRLIATREMQLLTRISGSQLRVVRGGGHLFSLTHPDALANAIEDVVNSLD